MIIDDTKFIQNLDKYSIANPDTNLNTANNSLAYVLYTSGTTGKPKGVILEHKGCVSRIFYMIEQNELTTTDVTLFKTNYIFDVSFSDIFTTLLSGARLVITQEVFDPEEIKKHLELQKITICHFVPSQFAVIKDDLEFEKYPCLNRIMFSGEKLSIGSLSGIKAANYTILNYYGPTETGEVTLSKFTLNDLQTNSFAGTSIGKPFANIKCYILDNNLHPVSLGVIGELYIGGIGLAQSYLNLPELTKERFLSNPFGNGQIYKTGDQVRWLPNGEIEYIGRNDSQVKIRGYRIELSEIEEKLATYHDINQCTALAYKCNNRDAWYIVAYYVAEKKLDENKILSYLGKYLPDYMLPHTIVYLKEFPLTNNGKLDKGKLPPAQFNINETLALPRNELEAKLVKLLEKVLGLTSDSIGIKDNFFKIGGDSILAIRFLSSIKQQLGINISVKDLFNWKSIEGLYDNVLNKNRQSTVVTARTEQGILSGSFKLLPIQKWFFGLNLRQINHWNQSFLVKTPQLDIAKLNTFVKKLIEYHDAFKLRYKKQSQYYKANAELPAVKLLDVNSLGYPENSQEFIHELEEIFTRWQSTFDIQNGPIYTIAYIYGYKDQSARIYFAVHHLAIDSVSWRILAEDLQSLYENKSLGLKSSSYRQWVDTVQAYAKINNDERTYWKTILADYRRASNLVLKPLTIEENSSRSTIIFDEKLTSLLVHKSNNAYNTQINDLLLSALGFSLSQVTSSNVNHILLEGHGREEIAEDIDISRTVGWFTTLFPVRLEVVKNNIGDSIKNIKETLSLIPNKGIGYGELIGYAGTDLPKVTFNYLGQFNSQDSTDLSNWEIVGESSGAYVSPKNQNYNVISINGLIIGGCLCFYIQGQLNQQIIDELSKSFKDHLSNIIYHCSLQEISQYTISDFKDFEPYVIYNTNKNASNLFIFPPGLGGAESYLNNLVPHLKDDFNLILFNNFYTYLRLTKKLTNQELEYVTYEFLATLYIAYIKTIQPYGPYNFVGWSFGGVLAFEVTRQLIRGGDTVHNIFLLDSYFNYAAAIKTVMDDKVYEPNDINYKYQPLTTDLAGVNIFLFKSKQGVKISDLVLETDREIAKQRCYIMNYYARYVKDNNLKEVAVRGNIKIINLKATHINLITNQVAIIVKVIRDTLK